MNEKLLILLVATSTVLILVLGIFFVGKTQPPALEASGNAEVQLMEETSHDWGQIDINGGNVEKTFLIKNSGTESLQITNVKTSCMCTEAEIIVGEEKSPVFGMHSRSGWKGVVEPGQTAQVHVVFDPLFHGPQATGPITRLVSMETNDADNTEVEFKLTGNVVDVVN